jgi:hypothetical protein
MELDIQQKALARSEFPPPVWCWRPPNSQSAVGVVLFPGHPSNISSLANLT